MVDDHVELAARGVRPFAGASVAIVEQTESICTGRRLHCSYARARRISFEGFHRVRNLARIVRFAAVALLDFGFDENITFLSGGRRRLVEIAGSGWSERATYNHKYSAMNFRIGSLHTWQGISRSLSTSASLTQAVWPQGWKKTLGAFSWQMAHWGPPSAAFESLLTNALHDLA